MVIKRRQFLRSGSLAAAGTLLVPRFLQAFNGKLGAPLPSGTKTLVVIQLSGGNDGLNTIIPVRNDIYYQQRPRLGIKREIALPVADEAGLHPALTHFRELYNQGHLAIMNNVGYPNPDRSHFRSMDIWQTGSSAQQYWNTGWLGRYLDAQCQQCEHPTQILEIDEVLSLALKGRQQKGIALQDPARLYQAAHTPFFAQMTQARHQEEPVANYLYKTLTSTLQSADYLFKEARKAPPASHFPNTQLGKSLHTIASLIQSDINTRVYYVSLGSFDTHINQEIQQARLFKELNDAVGAFVQTLKTAGRFNDTLIVTFSEFGRRVAQNASGGTDHGTANNMFFIGGSLKKQGLLNPLPDLANLDSGDLIFKVDFREVYATLLEKWLGAPHQSVLEQSFRMHDFV